MGGVLPWWSCEVKPYVPIPISSGMASAQKPRQRTDSVAGKWNGQASRPLGSVPLAGPLSGGSVPLTWVDLTYDNVGR